MISRLSDTEVGEIARAGLLPRPSDTLVDELSRVTYIAPPSGGGRLVQQSDYADLTFRNLMLVYGEAAVRQAMLDLVARDNADRESVENVVEAVHAESRKRKAETDKREYETYEKIKRYRNYALHVDIQPEEDMNAAPEDRFKKLIEPPANPNPMRMSSHNEREKLPKSIPTAVNPVVIWGHRVESPMQKPSPVVQTVAAEMFIPRTSSSASYMFEEDEKQASPRNPYTRVSASVVAEDAKAAFTLNTKITNAKQRVVSLKNNARDLNDALYMGTSVIALMDEKASANGVILRRIEKDLVAQLRQFEMSYPADLTLDACTKICSCVSMHYEQFVVCVDELERCIADVQRVYCLDVSSLIDARASVSEKMERLISDMKTLDFFDFEDSTLADYIADIQATIGTVQMALIDLQQPSRSVGDFQTQCDLWENAATLIRNLLCMMWAMTEVISPITSYHEIIVDIGRSDDITVVTSLCKRATLLAAEVRTPLLHATKAKALYLNVIEETTPKLRNASAILPVFKLVTLIGNTVVRVLLAFETLQREMTASKADKLEQLTKKPTVVRDATPVADIPEPEPLRVDVEIVEPEPEPPRVEVEVVEPEAETQHIPEVVAVVLAEQEPQKEVQQHAEPPRDVLQTDSLHFPTVDMEVTVSTNAAPQPQPAAAAATAVAAAVDDQEPETAYDFFEEEGMSATAGAKKAPRITVLPPRSTAKPVHPGGARKKVPAADIPSAPTADAVAAKRTSKRVHGEIKS